MMLTEDHIASLLQPLLQGADMELLDLKVLGARGRVAFVAVVDHRHRPVKLDELTAISRQLEDRLDMDENIPREYSLDVTSPGVARSLEHDWEFAKNVGRTFSVTLHPSPDDTDDPAAPPPTREPMTRKQRRQARQDGKHSFEAELTAVADGTLTFDNGRVISLDEIRDARVKLPW